MTRVASRPPCCKGRSPPCAAPAPTCAAPPGSPPHSRAGLLKRSILFGLDKPAQAVVIGPAESVIGNAMAAHEFGGRYKRERYPARPLMGPTLTSTAPKLAQFWRDSVTD